MMKEYIFLALFAAAFISSLVELIRFLKVGKVGKEKDYVKLYIENKIIWMLIFLSVIATIIEKILAS